MSLDWRFTDEKRFSKMSTEDNLFNDCYVWGTLLLGLNEITEKNAKEWEWRMAFYTALNGPMYYYSNENSKKRKPYVATLEEIEKRIGLKTNASKKTRSQFVKDMAKNFKVSS